MKRTIAPLLLIVALVAIAAAGYWMKRPPAAATVPCTDPVAGCDFIHQGQRARIRFSVRPVPMQPFDIQLDASGASRASAEFQMVGMDMGFNRYDLRPQSDGALTARVTLPICVSGRRDWKLHLDIDSARYVMLFSTQ